ncbi:PDR/VanB family oxidoreductase [Tardiphaga sp.]|jgi:ferredoxin-NADP reductase|uniref:PDR/VanB family oxidoreductase n=1 Tax=Tardiphaga sp. TaxID=1926292 RepID=UPI0037DA5886
MASSELGLKLRLVEVRYGAPGINLYRLAACDGQPLPAIEPGAHIDLEVAPGFLRQYSLLWPQPRLDTYEIAVQEASEGRGGSRAWHRQSVTGEIYPGSEPRNLFALNAATATTSYLLAGGIGITPIISMYRKLVAEGRPVQLHYWTRSAEAALFHDELAAVSDGSVRLHHTSGPAPRLADVLADIPNDAPLYCCGPTRMIDAFDDLTAQRPLHLVHRERFAAAPVEAGPAGSFSIHLARSGRTLEVGADETVLSACLAAGIDLDYSCEEGICGACEVRVLSGSVDHRDQVIAPAARATSTVMMACCSRGLTTLDLDI